MNRMQLRRVHRGIQSQGIANKLSTPEGRKALAESMIEPIKRSLELRALFPVTIYMTKDYYEKNKDKFSRYKVEFKPLKYFKNPNLELSDLYTISSRLSWGMEGL